VLAGKNRERVIETKAFCSLACAYELRDGHIVDHKKRVGFCQIFLWCDGKARSILPILRTATGGSMQIATTGPIRLRSHP